MNGKGLLKKTNSMNRLELNWVRKEDKSLLMPQVVFSRCNLYGGRYYPPEEDETLIEDQFYPLNKGIIEISTLHPEDIENTIAHEWRHHWQQCHGWEYDGIGWDILPEDSDDKYYEAVVDYFTQSYSEFDALCFESERCGYDGYKQYWWELITKSLEKQNIPID